MTHVEGVGEVRVLLVGEDAALLEGLSQSFAALGYLPQVVQTLHEARESALASPPLLAVVDGELAAESGADALAIQLAPGGALVLYHNAVEDRSDISPTLQRAVLAELTLPLERNRLIALAQHVQKRARATGRGKRPTPPEQRLT
jgi:DNA-binding NtrC family response regulator